METVRNEVDFNPTAFQNLMAFVLALDILDDVIVSGKSPYQFLHPLKQMLERLVRKEVPE